MNASTNYILISIIFILIVAVLVFFVSKNRSENHLTPLNGLAFGFILAGILFGENRYLGYGLMAVGVIVAVIDIFTAARCKRLFTSWIVGVEQRSAPLYPLFSCLSGRYLDESSGWSIV